MAKKKQSASDKAQYQMYKTSNRWLNNRIKRFERIVKKFPKDTKAAAYLAKLIAGNVPYRRHRMGA